MQVEGYISELLYDNDCVIVPDFGGFIGNYAPAKIDPVKHLFEPPHKNILFNKGLTQNDGLLANYISNKQQVSYTAALNVLTDEVKRYRDELKQNKRLALDNIGVLLLDEHDNLIFQPDDKVNYLPEAFGLSSFFHLPVTTEKEEKESNVVLLHKERSRLRPYAIAAAIGALIASSFWFTMQETNLKVNYSSLNVFAKKEAKQYAFSSAPNSINLIKVAPQDSLPFVIAQPKASLADIASSNYHIVAGCFRYLENAQTLVGELQHKNVEAAIIGKNPQGLYIVGCGKYSSYNEAESHLDTFRKSVQADAWVFGKK
ncbi:MAG TPA: SPOR domain-containing protein [Bacteroidia bacterium]|jgi:hypothetical protein|nr:SPOR domain-containing protein [Bacteroidia bacterium]